MLKPGRTGRPTGRPRVGPKIQVRLSPYAFDQVKLYGKDVSKTVHEIVEHFFTGDDTVHCVRCRAEIMRRREEKPTAD